MLAEYETGLDRLALNRSVFREEEGERARDRHADGGASEQEDIWKSRYLAEKKARTDGRRKDRRNQLLPFGRAIRGQLLDRRQHFSIYSPMKWPSPPIADHPLRK